MTLKAFELGYYKVQHRADEGLISKHYGSFMDPSIALKCFNKQRYRLEATGVFKFEGQSELSDKNNLIMKKWKQYDGSDEWVETDSALEVIYELFADDDPEYQEED